MQRLLAALDDLLSPSLHGGTHGLVRGDGGREVRTLALALDAGGLAGLDLDAADALFLHRPWRAHTPPGLPVIASHEPFDAVLGLGPHGRHVRDALGLDAGAPLGDDVPGTIHHDAPTGLADRVRDVFGTPLEHDPWDVSRSHVAQRRQTETRRAVAVVAALRPRTVRAAAAAGAGLYITGHWRDRAARALGDCGMGCLAVGHARSERWALGTLARELEQRVPGLRCVLG